MKQHKQLPNNPYHITDKKSKKHYWIKTHCSTCGIHKELNTSWQFEICYRSCIQRNYIP
jgi:hypothetical protein